MCLVSPSTARCKRGSSALILGLEPASEETPAIAGTSPWILSSAPATCRRAHVTPPASFFQARGGKSGALRVLGESGASYAEQLAASSSWPWALQRRYAGAVQTLLRRNLTSTGDMAERGGGRFLLPAVFTSRKHHVCGSFCFHIPTLPHRRLHIRRPLLFHPFLRQSAGAPVACLFAASRISPFFSSAITLARAPSSHENGMIPSVCRSGTTAHLFGRWSRASGYRGPVPLPLSRIRLQLRTSSRARAVPGRNHRAHSPRPHPRPGPCTPRLSRTPSTSQDAGATLLHLLAIRHGPRRRRGAGQIFGVACRLDAAAFSLHSLLAATQTTRAETDALRLSEHCWRNLLIGDAGECAVQY
ncbi:hypothetical protein GGX14DRAFT_577878 [Mycena pura]|uniref:Uncharacterized protein n=1 Tax=Mycena pura TaxID=153505 RepID=A0AAD6Y5T1_9AGAR|nr:hypothetical protein GGX14DRAFT_577878 [Mycena pura]